MSFKIHKPYYYYSPPPALMGQVNFVGVERDGDPDGTITGVIVENNTFQGYKIGTPTIFVADNTAIYTAAGLTPDNATAYIIGIPITFNKPNLFPVITATPRINFIGTANAIVNQILPAQVSIDRNSAMLTYTVVIFGVSQKASNDLLETIFTPTPNPFDPTKTLTSGVNFVITFSL